MNASTVHLNAGKQMQTRLLPLRNKLAECEWRDAVRGLATLFFVLRGACKSCSDTTRVSSRHSRTCNVRRLHR